jgi:hypothetical protein
MRMYALFEAGDPETIDLFLTEEDAQRALEGCLRDEPEWRGLGLRKWLRPCVVKPRVTQ